MRILLLGEYSNVHHTLCQALRRAGHDVLLISDGDGWKDYPRDIDLRRKQEGPIGSLRYLAKLATLLHKMRGYDVVEIVNPIFLDVKPRWNRWVFDYLRRHNRQVWVGCFGDDYYVIKRMQDDQFLAYTDFYAAGRSIDHPLNRKRIQTWLHTSKAALTQYVMAHADRLMACLYEYYRVYDTPEFHDRLRYFPLPIELSTANSQQSTADVTKGSDPFVTSRSVPAVTSRTVILFAAQKKRGQMKGTDQLEPLFDRLAREYPDRVELRKIESVPFSEYQRLVAEADVVVDQLYSFTPAMGALEAMSQGKVVVSGYEPAYRAFIEGPEESGIINLRPFEDEENYGILVETLTDPQKIAQLKQSSQAFVRKYHDADEIAKQLIIDN